MTVLYALTKLLEHHDHKVYAFGGIQSGHRLKHLAAAAACFAILEAVTSSPTAGVKVGPQVNVENPRLPLGLLLQPRA
jgi:hypothetical protein